MTASRVRRQLDRVVLTLHPQSMMNLREHLRNICGSPQNANPCGLELMEIRSIAYRRAWLRAEERQTRRAPSLTNRQTVTALTIRFFFYSGSAINVFKAVHGFSLKALPNR